MKKSTESFLEEVYTKISASIAADVQTAINKSMCEKLSQLVNMDVITEDDAEEFAKGHRFIITKKTRRTPEPSADPCRATGTVVSNGRC